MKTTKSILTGLLALAFLNLSAQEFKVNTEKSVLEWHAAKVSGEHNGHIDLKSGEFTVNNNKITDGKFVIDMTTISNEDVKSDEWRKKLVDHLNSDDFFSTSNHKESVLEITESTPFKDNKANAKGKLTIKGITKPISFDVVKDGLTYTANVTVDRTKYDIKYGSGKFFDDLGDNMIDDEFTLKVTIVPSNK